MSHPKTILVIPSFQAPLIYIGMMAAAPIYNSQMSPDEYYRSPSPTTSLSPTLVNNARYTERPSLKLSFTSGASNILNSAVVDPANQTLYSISSNSKRTTMVSCRDNVEVATVQWDRHSPRMVFRRKKVKCKEWLKLAGPDNEYMPISRYPLLMWFLIGLEHGFPRSRILTLGDAQFTWMRGQGSASGHVRICSRLNAFCEG
jgi:hypothetical protein